METDLLRVQAFGIGGEAAPGPVPRVSGRTLSVVGRTCYPLGSAGRAAWDGLGRGPIGSGDVTFEGAGFHP